VILGCEVLGLRSREGMTGVWHGGDDDAHGFNWGSAGVT
jgi:hypothetical protein